MLTVYQTSRVSHCKAWMERCCL